MEPTTSGNNRSGAAAAADGVREMLAANERWAPNQIPDTTLADEERRLYILDSDPVGSIPPPVTIPGMLKTGLQKMMGERPEMLMDKIGERIAFERGGTRLYDALIGKYQALTQTEGAPELPVPLDAGAGSASETLLRIRTEEHQHFQMLCEVMTSLGGDPTAVTPCADVIATASLGLIQVVTDPRTTLAQSLNAILTAELTDNAGWELLITLAEGAGHSDVAERFRAALAQEQQHLVTVKAWVEALATTSTTTKTAAV
jgi:rubrerythrin